MKDNNIIIKLIKEWRYTIPFLFLFAPIILNLKSFPYDFSGYHFAHWAYQIKNFHPFEFIFYDPFTYAGSLYYQNFQSMQFYLPFYIYKIILAVSRIDVTLYGVQYINLFHYFLIFIGCYKYAKYKKCSNLMCLIIASGLVSAGPIISNAQHAGVIASISWFIWLIYLTEKYNDIQRNNELNILPKIAIKILICNIMIVTSGFIPILIPIYIMYFLFLLFITKNTSLSKINLIILYLLPIVSLLIISPFWLPYIIDVKNHSMSPHGSSNPIYYFSILYPNTFGHFSRDFNFSFDPTTTFYYSSLIIFAATISLKLKEYKFLILALVALLISCDVFSTNKFLSLLPFIGNLFRPYLFELFVIIFLFLSCLSIKTEQILINNIQYLIISVVIITITYLLIMKNELNISLILFTLINVITLNWLKKITNKSIRNNILIIIFLLPILFLVTTYDKNKIFYGSSSKHGHDYETKNPNDELHSYLGKLIDKSDEDFRIAIDQSKLQGSWNGLQRILKLESIGGFETDISDEYHKYLTDDFADWSTNRLFGKFKPNSIKFDELNIKYLVLRNDDETDYTKSLDWMKIYENNGISILEYKNFKSRFQLKECDKATKKIIKISEREYEIEINSLNTNDKCASEIFFSIPNHKEWRFILNDKIVYPDQNKFGYTLRFDPGTENKIKIFLSLTNFYNALIVSIFGVLTFIFLLYLLRINASSLLNKKPT